MPFCSRKGPSRSCASGVGLRQGRHVCRVSCGKHGLGQKLTALPFAYRCVALGASAHQRSRTASWRVHGQSLSSRHSSPGPVKSAALAGRASRTFPPRRCLGSSEEGAEWSSLHFQPHHLLHPKRHLLHVVFHSGRLPKVLFEQRMPSLKKKLKARKSRLEAGTIKSMNP